MKRTPLRRKGRRKLSPEEQEAARLFAATKVGPCVNCGERGQWFEMDAHHVVSAQELRSRGAPVYDTRNAMTLCRPCHARHESGHARLPTSLLRDTHWVFAREVLGDYAEDYVARYYA